MSQPQRPKKNDPAGDVLGAWQLGGDTLDSILGDSFVAPLPDAGRKDPKAPKLREPIKAKTGDSALGFQIGPTESILTGSMLLPSPTSLRKPVPTHAAHLPGTARDNSPAPAAHSTRLSPTANPPKPGEIIGGYRIVSELGRGAFARVYLAEQIDLGNRLVALKVSKAEGEEPQMLARLQHAHIVPIHSVHDDPETGLRLLCMPYLGGANLAQVLEAAGVRETAGPDRRSLVRALDEVSQRLQSGTNSRVGLNSARVSRFGSGLRGPKSQKIQGNSAVSRKRLSGSGSDATKREVDRPSLPQGSMPRLYQLWDRLPGFRSRNASELKSLDNRDFDQPARQFLRQANTVQGAVWIIARLAEGLEHAHSRGLLHRDLKPSNILIASDGTPMLLDFNLSSTTESADVAEGEKAMLGGTLPYMSPEHLDAFIPGSATSAESVDERSDLYALGLILFEMIAGEPAFEEPPQRLTLLESIKILSTQRQTIPSLRKLHPGVPWSLESIVKTCLAPDPSKRYARARDLAEDLNRFLDDRPLRIAPEPSYRERAAKWARRNPRLCGSSSIAGFAAVLILSLGGLISLLHGNMQNLSTRLKLQVFRDDLIECRFLLNLGSGPVDHLSAGTELAQKTLDQQRIDRDGDWRSDSWVRRLTAREQETLREQTTELILLEARAKVYLAGRKGNENDRREALEWAVNWLRRAEHLDPHPPGALFADRARYRAALGQSDLATEDRRREAATVPVSSRDFSLLGSGLLARGDLAQAEPALRRAVTLDSRSFWAWFALGHCHFDQNRHLDAAADFTACVVLEPKFAWPHLNLGLALARAGRLSEARVEYDRALEANPRFAEAWVNHSLVDLELGDLDDAERCLTEARSLGRRDPAVLAAFAEVKARRGDREGAEEVFARVLLQRPDDPVYLTARGIFRVPHDPKGARADFRRAVAFDPRNARAHYGLALLLRGSSPREALAEADLALDADPNLMDALQLRTLLRARLGELSAADDAERLIQLATPHRLYNAACALSLLVETAHETRLAPRALDLLDRSLLAGFPASHASTDPDLKSLRTLPGYNKILLKHSNLASPR